MKIDPRRSGFKRRLKPAAEFICVNLHPLKLKSSYVRNIRVKYHAPLIVYALQALSAGMTALFLGLLTNYLYDKYKVKQRDRRGARDKLKKLIVRQEENIKELNQLLKIEKSRRSTREGMQSLKLHKETLVKINDNDTSIEILLKESIEVLETHGSNALSRVIDSHWNRYD